MSKRNTREILDARPSSKAEIAQYLNIKGENIKTFTCTYISIHVPFQINFEFLKKIENLYNNCIFAKIYQPTSNILLFVIEILIKDIENFLIKNNLAALYKYTYYDPSIMFFASAHVSVDFLQDLKKFLNCSKFIMSGEGSCLKIYWN